MKKQTYGKKTVEPWYQSQEWKRIRTNHINGFTEVNGFRLSNKYCIQCFEESGKLELMHTADHPIPIKEGGDKRQPLRSLCRHHNAQKTARDGNKQRTKPK